MANWQRKSDYLLREIIKFRTYIDSLTAANTAKEELYKRKAESGGLRPLSPVVKDAAEGGEGREDERNLIAKVLPRVIHTSG